MNMLRVFWGPICLLTVISGGGADSWNDSPGHADFLSDVELVTATPFTLDPAWEESMTPSHIEGSCKAFIDAFGDSTAAFTKCMISHARPLRFCEHCVEPYVEAKSQYDDLMKADESGSYCRDIILNSDRVQLIVQASDFIDRMWDDCECGNCFEYYNDKNGTVYFELNNRTLEFKQMASEVHDCFVNHTQGIVTPYLAINVTNSTVCRDCSHIYKKLNELYEDLEDHFNNHVCMDIVDTMNYTRLMWSRDFHCSQQRGDMVPVLIVSGLFCLMPVVFYVGNKIHGTKLQNKIMKQKRLRDVAASMTDSAT